LSQAEAWVEQTKWSEIKSRWWSQPRRLGLWTKGSKWGRGWGRL